MLGDVVSLVVTTGGSSARRVAATLFPGVSARSFSREELRPPQPFTGPLFAELAGVPSGCCIALVTSVVWCGSADGCGLAPSAGALFAVTDHLNLELAGPLSGRWPSEVARVFPPTAGIYQPEVIRARAGARVYSSGVVAGVSDSRRPTVFEAATARTAGAFVLSDEVVPVALVAAYYGLSVAACGVFRTGAISMNDDEEE